MVFQNINWNELPNVDNGNGKIPNTILKIP